MLVMLTPSTSATAHSMSLPGCENVILFHLAESMRNVAIPQLSLMVCAAKE